MMKRTLIALIGTTALVGTAQAQMFDYAAYDADRDGSLTATEYRTGLERDGYFGRVDANADGRIGVDEYDDETTFTSYDADADGYLTEDEYYTGLSTSYDANRDGVFDENEFNTFADAGNRIVDGARDIVTGTVSAGAAVVEGVADGTANLLGFDDDGDRRLTSAEFNAALDGNDYFNRYDSNGDGFLAENEFNAQSRGYVAEYDADGDQRLSRDEYYGALYGAYDTNRDGQLAEDEYSLFVEQRMNQM